MNQEFRKNEVIKEYYLFLYDLAAKKQYENCSQMSSEEKEYCRKLLHGHNLVPDTLNLQTIQSILSESLRYGSMDFKIQK